MSNTTNIVQFFIRNEPMELLDTIKALKKITQGQVYFDGKNDVVLILSSTSVRSEIMQYNFRTRTHDVSVVCNKIIFDTMLKYFKYWGQDVGLCSKLKKDYHGNSTTKSVKTK